MKLEDLDAMLGDYKEEEYDPFQKGISEHDWESKCENIFSGEPYRFRCRKCAKWVKVERESTIQASLEEQGVQADCAMSMVQEVMTDQVEVDDG